jgi:hypothetical protein
MRQILNPLIVALAAVSATALAAQPDLSKLPPASDKKGLTYVKDIKSLLEESCLRCHGGERPKAGLRLDSLEGALQGTKDGKVILPGKSEKSLLVIAVAQLDPETAMPPKPKQGQGGRPGGSRPSGPPPGNPGAPSASQPGGAPGGPGGFGPPPKPLTPDQVGLIRAWIDQGAK